MILRTSTQSGLAVVGLITVALAGSACGGSGKGSGAGEALAADGKTCSTKIESDFQQAVDMHQMGNKDGKQKLQTLKTNLAGFCDKYKGASCVSTDTQETMNVNDKCQELNKLIDNKLAQLNGGAPAGGNGGGANPGNPFGG